MAKSRKTSFNSKSRDALYEKVGRRVREARRAAKLTQENLAERVSLTRTSVTNIEKGRQKLLLHTLFELAAAMKIPVDRLIPEPQQEAPVQIEEKASENLSEVEREWILSELTKSSRKTDLIL